MQLIGQIQYSYALNWANTAHLGKYSTVMRLIGQIQHTWANAVQLCEEFICGMLHKQHCKSLKPAKLIQRVRSTTRNRSYKHLLIV